MQTNYRCKYCGVEGTAEFFSEENNICNECANSTLRNNPKKNIVEPRNTVTMKKEIFILCIGCVALYFLAMVVHFFASSVSGQVIDAQNNAPIKDAVVFVEWLVGGGITSTEIQKIAEVTTDEKGKFYIFGTLHLFPHSPRILIYKRGYVAWNDERLFPDLEPRTGHTGFIRLQKFEPEYPEIEPLDISSLKIDPALTRGVKLYRWRGKKTFNPKNTYYSHMEFIEFRFLDTGKLMNKALEWEREKAEQDVNTLIEIDFTGTIVDAKTHKPVEGALLTIDADGRGWIAGRHWENRSNKFGKIKIFARLPLFASRPFIKIRHAGYSDWESVDQDKHKYKDGIWKNNIIFELN